MPPETASASALVRKKAYRMAVSFSSAPRGRYPALPLCLVSGGRSADITAGAQVWFRAAGPAALIDDLGGDKGGGHGGDPVGIAGRVADGIGIGGGGGRVDDALARSRRHRRHRFGHDSLAHDRLACAPPGLRPAV